MSLRSRSITINTSAAILSLRSHLLLYCWTHSAYPKHPQNVSPSCRRSAHVGFWIARRPRYRTSVFVLALARRTSNSSRIHRLDWWFVHTPSCIDVSTGVAASMEGGCAYHNPIRDQCLERHAHDDGSLWQGARRTQVGLRIMLFVRSGIME